MNYTRSKLKGGKKINENLSQGRHPQMFSSGSIPNLLDSTSTSSVWRAQSSHH
jgi:hypothetical protein